MDNRIMRDRARRLRREMTDAEQALWQRLRRRQMLDCVFRRQYRLGPYIADFVCLEKRLIVEVDGGQHNDDDRRTHDERRTAWLEEQGYRVLRFWNNEVLSDRQNVLETIARHLSGEEVPLRS